MRATIINMFDKIYFEIFPGLMQRYEYIKIHLPAKLFFLLVRFVPSDNEYAQ